MNILMINKFLHPNGGSETYIFKLGARLQTMGHEVQYFGMEHEGRVVGNHAGAYTANMDFHGGSKLQKLTYPVKTIYSAEARRKLRLVLEDFQPDVCHLNNFNYQLTPSIILEIRKWQRQTGHRCKILYTAHDYQLICPNHMCYDPNTGENCEKCLGGHFLACAKGRCIHGSLAKSLTGAMEAFVWKWAGVYKQLDKIICCSRFMKEKLDTNPVFREKTVAIHNFIDGVCRTGAQKQEYVLYFGRYSQEKGIDLLIQAAKALPHVQFVFAGAGPLESELAKVRNIKNVGFQQAEDLQELVRQARLSVYPSRWYENCPFSVMESQMYGTPVLGADIGGISELIEAGKTGELFESGNAEALQNAIARLWEDDETISRYTEGCAELGFDTVQTYAEKMIGIYRD